MMQKQNYTLCITPQNKIYQGEVYIEQTPLLKSSLSKSLSNEQLLATYLGFISLHKEWASKQHLVLTLKLNEQYLALTYEPLKVCQVGEIQGELPIELYLRYGRYISMNDFKQLLVRLKDGVIGNLQAFNK